ncbi:hypothetical protein [Dyella japonica]|uniref:Uncharacterized protein n=1 Tax=Dyella japonica TaxID=231455 RepID=A0ABV2JR88_9GAMM
MNKKYMMLAGVTALLTVSAAFATSDNNKTIQQVGVQYNGPGYVVFNEPLSVSCQYGLVYIPDVSTASGKAMLAVLLSAQAAGKPISRLDYTQAADGTCSAAIIAAGS